MPPVLHRGISPDLKLFMEPKVFTSFSSRISGISTVDGDNVEVKVENARADLLYSYHDAGYANVHVYPFSSLTDAVLPNYQSIYNDYINNVVLSLDSSITIGSVFN